MYVCLSFAFTCISVFCKYVYRQTAGRSVDTYVCMHACSVVVRLFVCFCLFACLYV